MYQRILTRGATSVICLLLLAADVEGQKCFACRAEGRLGNCRDPFVLNITTVENVHDVEAVSCASGWCGKVIEGDPTEDQDLVIERKCFRRPPQDNFEQCSEAAYGAMKVFRCFCHGNLCNTTSVSSPSTQIFILLAAVHILAYRGSVNTY